MMAGLRAVMKDRTPPNRPYDSAATPAISNAKPIDCTAPNASVRFRMGISNTPPSAVSTRLCAMLAAVAPNLVKATSIPRSKVGNARHTMPMSPTRSNMVVFRATKNGGSRDTTWKSGWATASEVNAKMWRAWVADRPVERLNAMATVCERLTVRRPTGEC